MEQIKHETLLSLARQNKINLATVIASGDGFHVSVKSGKTDHVLISKRGQTRVFANMDSAGKYLSSAGIRAFHVDMTRSGKKEKTRTRRDVAYRMRKIHRSYDEYVLSQIEEAKKDPRPAIPHDTVMQDVDTLIRDIEKKKNG